MPFDAASVAALVAQARARTYDGVFDIAVAATPYRRTGASVGIPAAPSIAPVSAATARLYSFAANYRRRTLVGYVVADAGFDLVARGLLAQYAIDQFDCVDRRYPPVYVFGQRVNPD